MLLLWRKSKNEIKNWIYYAIGGKWKWSFLSSCTWRWIIPISLNRHKNFLIRQCILNYVLYFNQPLQGIIHVSRYWSAIKWKKHVNRSKQVNYVVSGSRIFFLRYRLSSFTNAVQFMVLVWRLRWSKYNIICR